jgi:hypothetical protein
MPNRAGNLVLCHLKDLGWHALRYSWYSEGRAGHRLFARPSEYLRACHPDPKSRL